MKQLYKHIIPAAVAILALAGCDNGDIEPNVDNIAPTFTAVIDGSPSRVTGTQWDEGDKIGISCTTTAMLTTNVCHVLDSSSGMFVVNNPDERIYFKTGTRDTKADFKAYYPWVNTTATAIPFDTSDQDDQENFDFLFANASATKENPNVALNFQHKLSMLTFVFKNGKDMDVSQIKRCSFGKIYLEGTFNITTGTASATTSGKTISPITLYLSDVKDGEPIRPIIVIPQSLTSVPRPLKLEIEAGAGQTFEADINFPSNNISSGRNYKFTVIVNKTGLNVGECTIENWNDVEAGDGTADSADSPEE